MGNLHPIPTNLTPLAACASDNLLIAMTIMMHYDMSRRDRKVFLPTPHRMNAKVVHSATLWYNSQLPRLAAKVRACASTVRFYEHVKKLQAVIRNAWMLKIKPKPLQNTAVWPATEDIVTKWRFKVVRGALSSEGES